MSLPNYYTNESIYILTFIVLIIYIFLIFTLFILLSSFDIRSVRNLSDLKKFGVLFPFNFLFLITILSFAGIPPLFGFSIKLIVFLLLINSSISFYLVILAIFNFFTLYFYIQNIRYLVSNSPNNYYIYANYFVVLSDVNMFVSIIFFIINILGVLYLSDIIIFSSLFAAQ